ncbi:MAG: DUF2147 domain-containing protein [Rhizobacter sp.]|uniref:DUF2147 domain-containing protein n=1 Tax=Piscinibacter gummiphilus TaxID=946333 RepID=A0ABZ0CXS7_9BURK|nr:DUF2147 domain-containing protein [Piscinibacter gummiphilus]MBX3625621.1 DUF2147 domain-containing protein [Rhizobacter sp.]WOB09321.1 DUF2147 domain-containing protein [Piscinibacter gummiphilus]
MKKLLAAAAALMVSGVAFAQNATPVGLWKSIDEKSKVEKSLVRITESGGVVVGKIEKLLDPAVKPDAVCDECHGELKGKPIVGLTIIAGAKKNPEEAAQWDGGTVLDPANGKTYKLRLRPSADNKKLEVRGYIGTPMIGRSQTWVRVE